MSARTTATSLEYCRPAILDEILAGGNKVIDASAGTGKTFTIEHIVVDLIRTGAASLEQILVVTFTEKATAELRNRIRTTLENVLAGRATIATPSAKRITLVEAECERLKAALFSFHRAAIHTIHSFCHRILAELAFDSGTRFGIDLTSGQVAFHEALRAELRERLKSDARIERLMAEWLSEERRTSDTLEDLLWRAHSQRYLRTGSGQRNRAALTDLANSFNARELIDALRSAATTNEARDDGVAATKELAAILKSANGSCESLADALCDFDLNLLCNPKRRRGSSKSGFPPQSLARFVDAVNRASCALAIEQRIVDGLLPAIAARMDARKRERGTLDYEDMLGWLSDALDGTRGKSLAAGLRERYRAVLVDEFQDTDELQWRIFRRVFVESGGGHSVYVIGDPKQAIYGFRGADVHAYLEARRQLCDSGATIVPLRENFRSTADMIEVCNLIFDQTGSAPLFTGEIRYSQPVECGRPDIKATSPDARATTPISLIKFQPRDARYGFSRRMREAIGRGIAREIRKLLAPAESIEIHGDGAAPRRVTAKDVYVLTRTNRDSTEIAGFLRDAGVPFAFYKQDGLFETSEAADILDVLRAIEEPGRRSNRLKAWASPFFAVEYADLARVDSERTSQPMLDRLFQWRAIADAGRLADLFDALLNRSGLVERELLLSDSLRELTNYEHVFEILTHHASRDGVELAEIIDLLDGYVSGRAIPADDDSDLQRFEDERDAVQIMTIHKSKGLEADVVALYGGFFANNQPDPVRVYHDRGERRLAIGKAAQEQASVQIKQERDEEEQRLLYVALTRARAKLILPHVPAGALNRNRDLTGPYRQLNDRLRRLEGDGRAKAFVKIENMFVLAQTDSSSDRETPKSPLDEKSICEWLQSTARDVGIERLDEVRFEHRGLKIDSYTSLQAAEPEDFKTSIDVVDARAENADLPGGRRVGLYLHEAIERLDLSSFGSTPDLESWMTRSDERDLFASLMRRHGLKDQRWLDRGRAMVFNALTSPVALGEEVLESALYRLPSVREMEFAYPIPEANHPLLGTSRDGAWTVERGYVKGFIDLVFQRGDLMYFADWKGDLLASYEPAAVAEHVERHYPLQVRIYSLGVVRMLAIKTEQEYERRFGGLLYVFLRGVSRDGQGKTGLYFARPSWSEIVSYEYELLKESSSEFDA